jgi:hypothetical protein
MTSHVACLQQISGCLLCLTEDKLLASALNLWADLVVFPTAFHLSLLVPAKFFMTSNVSFLLEHLDCSVPGSVLLASFSSSSCDPGCLLTCPGEPVCNA